MGDELTLLLEVFSKIEKAGGQATLSVATVGWWHYPRQLGVAIVHGCYCDESTDDFDNICGVCYCDNVGEISSDLYRYHGVTF